MPRFQTLSLEKMAFRVSIATSIPVTLKNFINYFFLDCLNLWPRGHWPGPD